MAVSLWGETSSRLRGKEAALSGEGRIGGCDGRVGKRDRQEQSQNGKDRFATEVVPWADLARQGSAPQLPGLGLRSILRDLVFLYQHAAHSVIP